MKKIILLIVFIMMCIITACDSSNNMNEDQQQTFNKEITEKFVELEYKGHIYIYYKDKQGYKGYAGLTHAGHCPCNKK